ncbi:MAG: PEGA domain-containing protein, partial [bacterium]|nr:PEGA domain-containing protein [bacterium]
CSEDKEFIDMLVDEAKLSVLLSHTNIVQVYDLGKVGDDYFISMEFINGINLREFLNRLKDKGENFSEELVVYIISEVCKGLDYAHSKKDAEGNPLNIVHRDISPQNILLSFEGEVKIVDFGIAKAAMNISHTMAGILKGKISYMSPEQALGKPIDRKTDIFSTGLMLHELLVNDKFFKGETQFEVLKKIRTTRINEKSFGDEVSDSVKKILAKSLAYSVKDRYETAGDMQIDLTRYLYTTYADFTPRKLAKLMKKLFADEIENKKEKEEKAPDMDSQTKSILISGGKQQNIVHRERAAAEQEITGTGKQPTQTFIESFVSGEREAPVEEPSITRTGHGAPPPPPPEPPEAPPEEEEITGQMPMPPVEEEEGPVEEPSLPKKRGGLKKLVYPLAAALLIGAGLWGYYKTDLFEPTPEEPPPPKITGTLNIQSTPEGAQILLDGKETQKVTPATLQDIEVGKPVQIALVKPKHKEWTQSLTLQDENPVAINPTLEVIPMGSIKIVSTPPGAKVFVDGKDTEKVTPTTLEDLPLSQTYALKLEMEKHRPVEEKVTVYSIEPIEFNKKLEAIQYGSARITSVPTGARIYINNNDSGRKTPTTLSDLEVGKRFNIRFAKNGYQDAHRSVDIASTGITNVRGTLAKIQEKPKEEKKTAPDTLKQAQEKTQQLEKQKQAEIQKQKELAQKREAERKEAERKQAEAKKREEEQKRAEAKKKEEPKKEQPIKQPTTGGGTYVSVASNPKGASVTINGRSVGRTPGKFKVTPGKPAEVTVSKSGMSSVTRVVTVNVGETRSLGTITLRGKLGGAGGTVVIDSNPSGAKVFLNGARQKTTPYRYRGLEPGKKYTFTVKKNGYKTWSRTVTVGDGSKSFMAKLKKL